MLKCVINTICFWNIHPHFFGNKWMNECIFTCGYSFPLHLMHGSIQSTSSQPKQHMPCPQWLDSELNTWSKQNQEDRVGLFSDFWGQRRCSFLLNMTGYEAVTPMFIARWGKKHVWKQNQLYKSKVEPSQESSLVLVTLLRSQIKPHVKAV